MDEKDKKDKKYSRYRVLSIICVLIFFAISTRLFDLQVINAGEYINQSDNKLVKRLTVPAPRGRILDRNGVVLADNKQDFILTFTDTDESYLHFFDTMESIFKILDDAKIQQTDNFPIKLNPFTFNFGSEDTSASAKTSKIRFMVDRGLADDIVHKKYDKDKSYYDLTTEQRNKIASDILKVSPKEAFNNLWDEYTENYTDSKSKICKALSKSEIKKINSYSDEEKRRFILVKDAIKMQSFSGSKPVIIANDLDKETALIIMQKSSALPGINVDVQPERYYPYNDFASPVIGYISRIGSIQSEKYEEKGYDVNTDYVGITGIESAFESILRGSNGEKIVNVNYNGKIVSELGRKEPYPGKDVYLTIDKNVQYAAEKSLEEQIKYLQEHPTSPDSDVNTSNATRGAVVAVDIHTGEVLAMASYPDFNPNDFLSSTGISTDMAKKYFLTDILDKARSYIRNRGLAAINHTTEDNMMSIMFPQELDSLGNVTSVNDKYDVLPKPLINYATTPTPPGSAFKPLTGIVGLETGVIVPSSTYDDEGYFKDKDNFSTTFKSDGRNGVVNLATAIQFSSNPYFMHVGELLRQSKGDDILSQYAWKFGLGSDPSSKTKGSTGIEISEGFGQTYNTAIAKNSYSFTYLDTTMADLLTGNSYLSGRRFKPIDLHYKSDTDSAEEKALKKDIKAHIQDSIKTGNRNEKYYEEQITKLIQMDDDYKTQNFTKNDIYLIVKQIVYEAVDEGHSQSIGGVNMYSACIGQGQDQFSPLQLANYIATIANGGTRYSAHLLKKITEADGSLVSEKKPEVAEKTGVSQSSLDAVKYGMYLVNQMGTGSSMSSFPIVTGGKTGSATFQNDQDNYGRTSSAVYVGFAPYEDPQIAVCAIIYDGGHGGNITSVAKAIYEAYFKDDLIKKFNYTPQEDYMKEIYGQK